MAKVKYISTILPTHDTVANKRRTFLGSNNHEEGGRLKLFLLRMARSTGNAVLPVVIVIWWWTCGTPKWSCWDPTATATADPAAFSAMVAPTATENNTNLNQRSIQRTPQVSEFKLCFPLFFQIEPFKFNQVENILSVPRLENFSQNFPGILKNMRKISYTNQQEIPTKRVH